MNTVNLILPISLLAISLVPIEIARGQQNAACRHENAPQSAPRPSAVVEWQTDAHLHTGLHKKAGVLSVSREGVEFRPAGGPVYRWQFVEIATFKLTPRDLILTGYENRAFPLPGQKRYHFSLSTPAPPEVAYEIREQVGKPSQNANPKPDRSAITSIPVRHRALFGGSNGTLRFHDDGIDYLTSQSGDARSWRWTDIQTVSSTDRYHVTVFGYRDTYSFELKQPVSQGLIDRVTDEVYAHNNTSQRSSYVDGC